MKKLARKLIRMAAKDGDQVAKELLKHIEKDGLMQMRIVCYESCDETVCFRWDDIIVIYQGLRDEEISVSWNNDVWVLCE